MWSLPHAAPGGPPQAFPVHMGQGRYLPGMVPMGPMQLGMMPPAHQVPQPPPQQLPSGGLPSFLAGKVTVAGRQSQPQGQHVPAEGAQQQQPPSAAPSSKRKNKRKSSPLDGVFDDLVVRFILNLEPAALEDLSRVCFAMEEAHWFYLDFYVDKNPKQYPQLPLKRFVKHMFERVPELQKFLDEHTPVEIVKLFEKYKQAVPVCGAIVLNTNLTKVLLVLPWGGKALGFPRGKINQNEREVDCAAREVLEETGLDLVERGLKLAEHDYIEKTSQGHRLRLFFVGGVDEGIKLKTRTRKEIANIEWVPVASLPKPGQQGGRLARVSPFTNDILQWVAQVKGATKTRTPKKKRPKAPQPKPPIAILTREIGATPAPPVQSFGKAEVEDVAAPAASGGALAMLAGAVATFQERADVPGRHSPLPVVQRRLPDLDLDKPASDDWESFVLDRRSVMNAFWQRS